MTTRALLSPRRRAAHQWLCAVMSGANANAFAVKNRRKIVRMELGHREAEDRAPLRRRRSVDLNAIDPVIAPAHRHQRPSCSRTRSFRFFRGSQPPPSQPHHRVRGSCLELCGSAFHSCDRRARLACRPRLIGRIFSTSPVFDQAAEPIVRASMAAKRRNPHPVIERYRKAARSAPVAHRDRIGVVDTNSRSRRPIDCPEGVGD